FKTLWDKNLIYQDYKSMHICPRCETALSNFEVTLEYKNIKDISAIVKFELADEPNVYVLAWTTTPWTLPGNVALAIGKDIKYVKIKSQNNGLKLKNNETYILAKERLCILGEEKYEIIEEFKGQELINKKYKPLFDYFSKNKNLKNYENGWQIYSGDFVSIEDGTGAVHIAPAFGEDDMNLGKENNLPFIQHVSFDGRITSEAIDFVDAEVKPKNNHQTTDIKIVEYLARYNKLFSKEEYEHSYPHCWRCDTPLLNYATNSWFVKVIKIKDGMIKNNQKISWVPGHIKNGRFGKWLEGARDWAISRSRYWGATLPVWKCEKCEKIKIIGSINDIKKHCVKSNNKYFVMRHGEAEHNVLNITNNILETSIKYNLTEKGKQQTKQTSQKLKDKKIDLIFSSDFHRAKQTAIIVAEEIGLNKEKIIYDSRIRECNIP
ncbi:MAG: class I tRNA ligase family protein, partial [Patescibacteria group bacterium]